jgi:MFS transporter, FSR family, fosmidomycin resistance protein
MNGIFYIGMVKALQKSFSVLYMLILPILYAEGVIDSAQVGYIGAILIVGTFTTGLVLTYLPDKFPRSYYLAFSLFLYLSSIILLGLSQSTVMLIAAYFLIGAALGIGFIITDEIAAQISEKGNRYGAFANIAMYGDLIRIICPAIAGLVYVQFRLPGLVAFAFVLFGLIIVAIYVFAQKHSLSTKVETGTALSGSPMKLLRQNKPYAFTLFLEFFDSFASSQLFVFLPTLLIFKNFTIDFAVGLQSIVFIGYFSGRWLVSLLAKRFKGYAAVAIAEVGLIATIVLLLILPPSLFLYVLCFGLGVFARGTSPVVKALVFDTLEDHQRRQGTALYMMLGDGGSALGQLLFGLLLAWFGVNAPFIGAAIAAGFVVVGCGVKLSRRKRE